MTTRDDDFLKGSIAGPQSDLDWEEAPWDRPHFGAPVLQITRVRVDGPDCADDLGALLARFRASGVALVSCRIPASQLAESMWLERHGFRFIEVVYHPSRSLDLDDALLSEPVCDVRSAVSADLDVLHEIAGTAFGHERLHADPRIDNAVANRRYQHWMRSALAHPTQRLEVVAEEGQTIGFFVIELRTDGTCYWHMNAIGREHQGRGLGRRAWLAMMRRAREAGARRVETCVAARNFRVLNLYSRLGFGLSEPEMTLHWLPTS